MREMKDIRLIPEGSLDGIESDFGILYVMSRSLQKKLMKEGFDKARLRFPGFLTLEEAAETVASGLFLRLDGNLVFNTYPFRDMKEKEAEKKKKDSEYPTLTRVEETEFQIPRTGLTFYAAEDYEGLRTGAAEIYEGTDLLGWEIRLSRTASTLNSMVKVVKSGGDFSSNIFEVMKTAAAVDSWYWIQKGILSTKVKGVMGHGIALDVYDPEHPEKGGIKHNEVGVSPELAALHGYKNGQKIRAKRFPLNYITSSGIFTIRILEGLGLSLGFTAWTITELFQGDCDGDLYFLFSPDELGQDEEEAWRHVRPSWRDRKILRDEPRLHLGLAHYGDPTPSDALVERKLRLHVGMITNLGRDCLRVYLIKSKFQGYSQEILGNIWNFFGVMVDKALDSRKGIKELFPIDQLIGYFRGTRNCVLPESQLLEKDVSPEMIQAVKDVRNSCMLSGDKLPSVRTEVSRSQIFRVLITLRNQMGPEARPIQELFQALRHKNVQDVSKAMVEDLLLEGDQDE